MRKEKFKPEWQSLQEYKVPEWFRNAKFGIWAHWGPQCGKVKRIKALGSKEKISWKQNADSLVIQKPNPIPNKIAGVFKICL